MGDDHHLVYDSLSHHADGRWRPGRAHPSMSRIATERGGDRDDGMEDGGDAVMEREVGDMR
jgi:hypothetical protein